MLMSKVIVIMYHFVKSKNDRNFKYFNYLTKINFINKLNI